jgi:SAM-dependent methyltransferase
MDTLRETSARLALRFVPSPVRARLQDVTALQRLAGRKPIDPKRSSPEAHARSQARWREEHPQLGLTFGEPLSGRPFIDKLAEHAELTDQSRLLEIGPGYGRLLSALLEEKRPFAAYTGVDISENNVAHLGHEFADPRITFITGDVATAEIPAFDVAFSSLVFKHFYPSFEAALTNLGSAVSDGGRIVFDLLEGRRAYFEADDATFVHWYERSEVEEIAARAGLRVLAFDQVEHAPHRIRLLAVVGR